ncbi:MAG: VOC family protein [Gaiellaceae bacterium]
MPGQMVHVEIPAGDTARAREFWGSLFGWEWQTVEAPTEYHMTRFSETTGGAIYAPDPPDERGARVYFGVDDINAAGARVNELGGEAGEAMPVPGMGWFSICTDTEGNEFGLWQTEPDAPAPSQ